MNAADSFRRILTRRPDMRTPVHYTLLQTVLQVDLFTPDGKRVAAFTTEQTKLEQNPMADLVHLLREGDTITYTLEGA